MSHAARTHARYSASSAYRWFECPGSIALLSRVPEEPSSAAAREGTLAHEVLELLIEAWQTGKTVALPPKGYGFLPEDMMGAVLDCVDLVQELCSRPGSVLLTEVNFKFPQTIVPPEDAGGTADIVVIWPDLGIVNVVDYKHGYDVVSEVGNKQTRFYAAGVWHELQDKYKLDKFITWIVQPRAFAPGGPIRNEVLSLPEMHKFIKQAHKAIEAAEQPGALLKSGKDICKYCAARALCPAAQKAALAIVREDFATVQDVAAIGLPDPFQLNADQLSYIKRSKKLLTDWLDSVDDAINTLLRRGGHVPNYKLVESQARRTWPADINSAAQQLIALSGFEWTEEDVSPRKLITITEAETRLRALYTENAPKGKKKHAKTQASEAMAYITTKQSSGTLTVAEESDPRPAVNAVKSAYQTVDLPLIETATIEKE